LWIFLATTFCIVILLIGNIIFIYFSFYLISKNYPLKCFLLFEFAKYGVDQRLLLLIMENENRVLEIKISWILITSTISLPQKNYWSNDILTLQGEDCVKLSSNSIQLVKEKRRSCLLVDSHRPNIVFLTANTSLKKNFDAFPNR